MKEQKKKQYFKLKEDGGYIVETDNGIIDNDKTQTIISGEFIVSATDISKLVSLLSKQETMQIKNMYSHGCFYKIVTLEGSELDKMVKRFVLNIEDKERIIKELTNKIIKYNKSFIGKLFPINIEKIFHGFKEPHHYPLFPRVDRATATTV